MIVRRTIDKDELKELPKVVFPGRIHVIQSESETEKAVAYLLSQPILGIDSETRPSFTKGQSHKVALLQISSEECCFLFRLNMTGLTQPLVDLLENPGIIKVGSLPDLKIERRPEITQISLKNFAWNIAYQYKLPGQLAAQFVMTTFHEWFADSTLYTVVKNLKTTSGNHAIPIDTHILKKY